MHVRPHYTALLAVTTLLLTACAASPFNKAALRDVDRRVTYAQALQNPDAVRNRQVLFGGSIVAVRNLEQHTEIILLVYPLTGWDRPNTSATPLGRLIVLQPGYLESMDFAPGRLLSVRGYLDGVRQEALGQSTYLYPVLQALELHLWPSEPEAVFPRFSIGVGVSSGHVGGAVGVPFP
ncbi:MAG: Slp family lipoprotein [Pseudomonadota bacterium]